MGDNSVPVTGNVVHTSETPLEPGALDPGAKGAAAEGGADFNAAIADLTAAFEMAQANSAKLREVGIIEGSILAADKKQATPV